MTNFLRFLIKFCLLLSLLAPNAWANSARILDMRVLDAPGQEWQFILDLSEPVAHKVFTLDNPARVVIDLNDAQLISQLKQFAAPGLNNIRSAVRNERDLRIVLDMQFAATTSAVLLKPQGVNGHRLVVSLIPPSQYFPPALPADSFRVASVPTAKTKQTIIQANPVVSPVISPQVERVSKPVPLKGKVNGRSVIVAVDAGHGGMDPGAIGGKGSYEKHIAMAIAKQLAALINQHRDMRAVLIRDGDYYLSLRERTERARRHQADVFVSIHADAYKDGGHAVQGSSVYMLSQRGASSEAAKWLAEKENAADLVGGVSLSDKDDILASVLLDLSQDGTLEASSFLGDSVLRSLRGIGPVHHRKVQQAAFIVLKSPDIPSILVETGFISNPLEENRLNTEAHRRKVAEAIYQGLDNYLQRYAPPGTALARRYGLLASQ